MLYFSRVYQKPAGESIPLAKAARTKTAGRPCCASCGVTEVLRRDVHPRRLSSRMLPPAFVSKMAMIFKAFCDENRVHLLKHFTKSRGAAQQASFGYPSCGYRYHHGLPCPVSVSALLASRGLGVGRPYRKERRSVSGNHSPDRAKDSCTESNVKLKKEADPGRSVPVSASLFFDPLAAFNTSRKSPAAGKAAGHTIKQKFEQDDSLISFALNLPHEARS